MKELSLHILDIAMNSVRANATRVEILLEEQKNEMTITIRDNGCGMSSEMLSRLNDPFFTTRTTRKIGLGIPLFRLAAEQTGGTLTITSSDDPVDHSTTTCALFYTDHIDCAPLGDIISTIVTLIQGSPELDFLFCHTKNGATIEFDTQTARSVLGDEISLALPEVLEWIRSHLADQYQSVE